MKKITTLAITATAVALTVLTGSSAKAQFTDWTSNSSTDPTVAANWNGTLPTFGGTNAGILDTGTATIAFTSAQTGTSFGTSGSAGGLTWIGEGSKSSISVSGGIINFSGAFGNDGGTESIWFGNGGASSTGALTITGGAVNVLNGTVVGRDGSAGTLAVSGGTFTTGVFSSSVGLFVGGSSATGAAGAGTVTIGNGGLVDVSGAALDPLSFSGTLASAAAGNSTSDFINFTTGSTGTLELNLSTATLGSSYFTNLINNGFVEVNGNLDTTLSDFSINTANAAASTLKLASAASTPEPSTWALMLGGAAMLVVLQRRRSLKA